MERHNDPLSGGHLGVVKCYDRLRDRYWWEGMYTAVQRYCSACLTCGSGKGGVGRAPYTNIPLPQRPFQLVGVDFVGPLPETSAGHKYILVVTDYLTRWGEAFPTKDCTAATAARGLMEEIVARHGFPESIISDRGSHFCDSTMSELWAMGNTRHIKTPAYRPQFNGLTERFNGTLKSMLKMYTDERQTDWDVYLPFVLFAYRTSYQDSLRATPFGLLYGRRATLPLDAALALPPDGGPTDRSGYVARLEEGFKSAYARARLNMERVQSRRDAVQAGDRPPPPVTVREFAVGDRVWFHTHPRSGDALTSSFLHEWRGPYEVVERTGRHVYRLRALGPARHNHVLFDEPLTHAQRMKPYRGPVPPAPDATYAATLQRIAPFMGPRWTGQHEDQCARCDMGGELALCDWCNDVYHAACAGTVTEGDDELWACPRCFMDGLAAAAAAAAAGPGGVVALGDAGAEVGEEKGEDEGVEEAKEGGELDPIEE